MRFSILFPAIVALAGCSQSNETSISPATSLQPVVAFSPEPDPEKVERLINDFVEACIVRNDGQPAADPMRPNSTVRYLRERGYFTGFFDQSPPGTFQKIYAENEKNWCATTVFGVSKEVPYLLHDKLRDTYELGYQIFEEHSSAKKVYILKPSLNKNGRIESFRVTLVYRLGDTFVLLETNTS